MKFRKNDVFKNFEVTERFTTLEKQDIIKKNYVLEEVQCLHGELFQALKDAGCHNGRTERKYGDRPNRGLCIFLRKSGCRFGGGTASSRVLTSA